MLRSMFTGISGLKNHLLKLDTVANNISNINTVGFKKERVNFQDVLSQIISAGTRPATGVGGVNPKEIGLGMNIASIDTLFTQGSLQTTGVNSDLAIQGNGMFILNDGQDDYYTRAGNFNIDRDGWLVNIANGWNVLGWQADIDGNIDTTSLLSKIFVPIGSTISAKATTTISNAGNLDASTNGALNWSNTKSTFTLLAESADVTFTFTPTGNFNEWRWNATTTSGTLDATSGTFSIDGTTGLVSAATDPTLTLTLPSGDITIDMPDVGDNLKDADADIFATAPATNTPSMVATFTSAPTKTTSINVYDSLGMAHQLNLIFTKTGSNTWSWLASGTGVTGGNGTLTFDATGKLLTSIVTNPITLVVPPAANITITPDLSGVSQYATSSTIIIKSQNGYAAGELNSYGVSDKGLVIGNYSNGIKQNLAQIALAHFSNYDGLKKEGDNMFSETGNSGLPLIGTVNTGGRGSILAGSLEMSNVDLSEEFTSMITAQRGFQANSKSITVADEILQDLLNLRR